jgi:hypothetical protein
MLRNLFTRKRRSTRERMSVHRPIRPTARCISRGASAHTRTLRPDTSTVFMMCSGSDRSTRWWRTRREMALTRLARAGRTSKRVRQMTYARAPIPHVRTTRIFSALFLSIGRFASVTKFTLIFQTLRSEVRRPRSVCQAQRVGSASY